MTERRQQIVNLIKAHRTITDRHQDMPAPLYRCVICWISEVRDVFARIQDEGDLFLSPSANRRTFYRTRFQIFIYRLWGYLVFVDWRQIFQWLNSMYAANREKLCFLGFLSLIQLVFFEMKVMWRGYPWKTYCLLDKWISWYCLN